LVLTLHAAPTTREPTRLQLLIEYDGEAQIHGSLGVIEQQPVPFTGWLQLISLLEAMSGQDPTQPPEEAVVT